MNSTLDFLMESDNKINGIGALPDIPGIFILTPRVIFPVCETEDYRCRQHPA